VNSTVRQIVFWVLIIGGAFLLYQVFSGRNTPKETPLSYSALLEKAQQKPTLVKKAQLEEGHGIKGELVSGEAFSTELPNEFAQADVAKTLRENGVPEVSFKSTSSSQWLIGLISYAPLLVFIGLWIFMMRQMQSG